jgi:putative acetyltransferase
MTLEIHEDDYSRPDISALLMTHLIKCQEISPPESCHALDLKAFESPRLTLWSARERGELMGCGALFELEVGHGEIKSMHTAAEGRRKGVGRGILERIVLTARTRGYQRLSLETGSQDYFAPARGLYAGFGFEVCEPFGPYVLDPLSVFMSRAL